MTLLTKITSVMVYIIAVGLCGLIFNATGNFQVFEQGDKGTLIDIVKMRGGEIVYNNEFTV